MCEGLLIFMKCPICMAATSMQSNCQLIRVSWKVGTVGNVLWKTQVGNPVSSPLPFHPCLFRIFFSEQINEVHSNTIKAPALQLQQRSEAVTVKFVLVKVWFVFSHDFLAGLAVTTVAALFIFNISFLQTLPIRYR